MKAAHGSQPAPRQHGNYARKYSASVNPGLNISSSANPKMVMPPFIRLDSTGEVSSEDGPAVQSKGIHRTPVYQNHRQGVSTSVCNGFLGNWMPYLTPKKPGFSSNQLTVSPQTMAQGGISALDQLINSRQSVDCVARQAMRSPVTMAHPSRLQRPSQYKNWGVMMAHGYPWLPQGVFPCHLFDAIHSGSQVWQPPSSGHFPTGAPNLVGTLLNSCEHFASKSYHQPHPVPPPGCKPMHEKVTKSSPQSDFKTSVLHPKSGMNSPKPDDIGQSMTAGCDKSTSVSHSEVEVPVKCDSPPDSQDLITDSHCTSEVLVEPSTHLCNCDQEISAEPLQEKNMAATHSSMQKSQHLPSKPSPAEEESIAEPSFSHDLVQNDDASSSVDSGITADCLDNQEDTAIRFVSDVVCSKEEPQNVQFQCGGLSGWSEVDVDTDCSDDDSQDDDTDADSDDQDDESDNEVDLESQAEAMNCFRVCELSEANFLHKKSKDKEIDQEKYAEQKRSPPKPDREANRRWDMHHPQRVPPGRTSKVQFACGNDVDEVHTIERETLTVMEIQKLRDISKQHNGRARHILRMKSSKCDFEEDDKSQGDMMSSSGGLCSSDGGVDVCDGASDVQVNSGLNLTGVSGQKQSADLKILKHPNDAKEKMDVDDDSEEENDDYGVAFWSESSVSTESEKEDGDESEDEKDNDEEVEEDDGFVIEFGNE